LDISRPDSEKNGNNTMKRFTRPFIWIVLAVLSLPMLLPGQQVSLTILHTNDTHGHLLPFSYPADVSPGSPLAGLAARANIGGIARRAGLVKKLRAELEQKGVTVWLVDVGDFSDGTAFSTEYHGEADAAAMNAAGYDFGALGNHEFNQPLAKVRSLLRLFQYPVLCANAVENSTGKLLTEASQIRNIGQLRIGLFGLVTAETSDYPAAREGITIAGEIETAQRMVKELKKNADIVILLSHCGDRLDRLMAESVPDLDVIVGGHSHSRLPWGDVVPRSRKAKPQDVKGTIIVQAYQWGGELGRLDLLFGRDTAGSWRVERQKAALLPITQSTPEDPAVAAVVARYWDPIAQRYGEIIGRAAADFVERGDDLAQYNLVADAVRESFNTEIGLENLGGVRAPLIRGNITRGALIDLDPFDNTVVTFMINGRTLRKILQSHRPAVSGIRYRMENGALTNVTIGGKPLQDNRIYTGVTNSYFARIALKGIQITNTGNQRLDVLTKYIRSKGTVHPVFDGRRVIVG
jgi:2',3'-cyclic-nucleotide 2'-phosphodiesterase (5'-nucleotidase family)